MSSSVPTPITTHTPQTSGGAGVTDGDKGDIVVSSSATVWSFDSGVVTAFARTFLDDADAAAVRTTIGAGTSSFNGEYGSLSGIPSTFAPSTHATSHSSGGGDPVTITNLAGFPADATQFLNGNGAFSVPAGAPNGIYDLYLIQANDQDVTNSNTPVDSTNLQFAVTAGSRWFIEVFGVYSGDSTAGDAFFRYHATAGNMLYMHKRYTVQSGGPNELTLAGASATDVTVGAFQTGSAHTSRLFFYSFIWIEFSSACTFSLQFAQNAATPATSARLYAGSIMRAKRMS